MQGTFIEGFLEQSVHPSHLYFMHRILIVICS